MIIEDYVSFETAKLLKEKRFNEDIDLWYDENGEMFSHYKYDISCDWRVKAQLKVYLCPTLQMAIKWLREIHNLHCQIDCPAVSPNWQYGIYNLHLKDWLTLKMMGNFDTYEEAAEAAIKYCLENLI